MLEEQPIDSNPVFESVALKDDAAPFMDILHRLVRPRDQKILLRRIYLGETLKSIGLSFNLSTERVRQIIAITIRKLKHRSIKGIEEIEAHWGDNSFPRNFYLAGDFWYIRH